MLTMHGLKQRGRTQAVETPAEPAPIITMQDARRHRQALKYYVKNQEEAHKAYDLNYPVDAWHEWDGTGPREFYHVMRDGAWAGHRAFVVGGGPSLRGFDWGLLKGELTIGVNRAFEKFEAGIMFSMDTRLWAFYEHGQLGEEAKERYRTYKGNRVWSVHNGNFILPEEVYVVKRPAGGELYRVGTVRELGSANNSGYGALNLALALGADPIYLLGFDMRGDGQGGQAWWHEGYPARQSESVYRKMITHINQLAKNIRGVRVVNLNPGSALNSFPKMDPAKVWAEPRPKKPIVVSFYTEGTGYQMEAYRLMESLHRFGWEYDVRPVPNMGGWKKNNDYKPRFIGEMLKAHPGRDVVWVDADAVMMAYPEELVNRECDFGCHVVEWWKYPGRESWTGKKEYLGGTVYVGNTRAGRKLVRDWVGYLASNPTLTDQQAMGKVVEAVDRDKVKVWEMPAAYCQIFDSMAAAGEPVIEHTQASRRLKGEVGR